jgi:hypothetical protein
MVDEPSDGLVDIDAFRREIETVLTEMMFAANAAGLKAQDPYRFMTRQLAASIRCSTALVSEVASETRASCVALAATREETDRREAMLTTRLTQVLRKKTRSLVVVAVVTIMVVAVICLGLVPERRAAAAFQVDLASRENGEITCGVGARDAAGDYHCTMAVVLKAGHTR